MTNGGGTSMNLSMLLNRALSLFAGMSVREQVSKWTGFDDSWKRNLALTRKCAFMTSMAQ